MRMFKRNRPEPERVRPDQVDRLWERASDVVWGEEVLEQSGSREAYDKATALLNAAERNSSEAELRAASLRGVI
jgi:hypothetical protein